MNRRRILMIIRTILSWFVILVLASLNGALRQALLIPSLGETAGRALSTILLSIVVVIATWVLLPVIAPGSLRAAWAVGGLWVVMTLAFEFLAGHFLFGSSWESLLADYDLARGRIWILVLVVTMTGPPLIHMVTHGAGAPASSR